MGKRVLSKVEISSEDRVVHLKEFGMVKTFQTISIEWEYWATDDLGMNEQKRKELAGDAWGIEVFHRGIKQCCGIERTQVRKGASVFNHISLSIRAFLRLEVYRLRAGISWYELKARIVRDAIRAYLANSIYLLKPTALVYQRTYATPRRMEVIVYDNHHARGGVSRRRAHPVNK